VVKVPTSRADHRVLPLWLHQGAEYGVGLLLAYMALHISGQMRIALLAAAGAMVAIAVLTDGPVGALRVLGPRAHQCADVGLMVGLAVSPLAVSGHLDTLAIIVAEAAAVILLRMATLTRYRPSVGTPGGGLMMRTVRLAASASRLPPAGSGPPPARGASRGPASRGPASRGPASRGRTARTLGFLAGRVQRETLRQAPRADRAVANGARQLGTLLGRRRRQPPRG